MNSTPSPFTSPRRVRARHVEWVHDRISDRDRAVIATVHRLRVVTGVQLQRLHFDQLAATSAGRTRRRVLARLVHWRALTTLERRIGGVRAGSDGLVYALDTAGQHLIRRWAADTGDKPPRRPQQPGVAFLTHTLAVAELYVRLIEHARVCGYDLTEFQAEPACWWPNDAGGLLKPDAYTLLATEKHQDAWWIEIDLATETLPRLRTKLRTYLHFARHGGTGPTGVMPRVLLAVSTPARCAAIGDLITGLPPPAAALFHTVPLDHAARHLIRTLQEPSSPTRKETRP